MRTDWVWLTSLCLMAAASDAVAEVLFDNGDPTYGYGTAILSELATFNQVGDEFIVQQETLVQGIEWWGSDLGNDFRVRIFACEDTVAAVNPVVDLDIGVLAGVPEDFPGGDFYRYNTVLPDVYLQPGRYLLSIVDQHETQTWFWAASCEAGCEGYSWRRPLDGDAWVRGNWSLSFRILGTRATPVPAGTGGLYVALGLVLLTAGGLKSWQWRRPRTLES